MSEVSEIRRKAKKRKYYFNFNCDYSSGLETDGLGRPLILQCPKRPVRFFPEFAWCGAYACDTHYEKTLQKMEES